MIQSTPPVDTPPAQTLLTGALGILMALFNWIVGATHWYANNLDEITRVIIHIAQLGGLVIMVLTIRNLIRNRKNKSSN